MIVYLPRCLLSIVLLFAPILVSAGGQSWEMRVIQYKKYSTTRATIVVNIPDQSFYEFPNKCANAVIHIKYHLSFNSSSKKTFTIVAHEYALNVLKKINLEKKVVRIGIFGGSGIHQALFSSKCTFRANAAAELLENSGNKAVYLLSRYQ